MTIISYWEMGEEDAPPQEYYGNDDAITEWFQAVKQRRMNPGTEVAETVPTWSNEHVKEIMS